MNTGSRSFGAILALSALVCDAAAQATPGPRRREPGYHSEIQADLSARHAGYAAFRVKAGGEWRVRFDEEGGTPAFLVGSGIPVSATPIVTLDAARAHAEATLREYPELWGTPISDLHLVDARKAGPLFLFTWQQRFDGLEVAGARVQIQVHEAGRVAALSTTATSIPPGFSRMPRLRPDDAARVVRTGKKLGASDSVASVDLVVFPKRANASTTPRLAFVVDVDQDSIALHERVVVDAESGEILEVVPRTCGADVKGKVTATVNTGLAPGAAPTPGVALEGATVSLHGGIAPATSSDAAGDYVLATSAPGPFLVVAGVAAGPFFDVTPLQGPSLVTTATSVPSGGSQVADLALNAMPSEFSTAQANAAYHFNLIRRYALEHVPTFEAFAQQAVLVNGLTPCTSSYSFATHALTFAAAGAGCPNTAYSTIVDHEFGHGTDDFFGGLTSEALSEAMSDILAMFATSQPIVGQDFYGPGTQLRTGENTVTWPQAETTCGGEPHCVGQAYMGFAWQAWKELAIETQARALFHAVPPVNSLGILDAVTQVFLLDDDDGDLTNGVPHYLPLAKAATKKGFIPPSFPFPFFPQSSFASGSSGGGLAFADLNGDGKLDLVTAGGAVFLGNGFGGFGPGAGVAGGIGGGSIALGDLNGDGKLDLAAATSAGAAVSAGNGLGGFGAPTTFATFGTPSCVAIADFNGDGKLDLATSNGDKASVSLLLGNGLGSFGAPKNFGVGFNPPTVAVGDLNADGRADIAAPSDYGHLVDVRLGNGLGDFGPEATYPVGPAPRSVAIADLNGDGKPELAVANSGADTVSILPNSGIGYFGTAKSFAMGSAPWSVAFADLNGDGLPDLATANYGSGSVSLRLGDGLGGFAAATSADVGGGPSFVAFVDLNGDGKLDLATANGGSGTISVLLGNGVGTYGVKTGFGAGSAPSFLTLADADGDGNLDAATTNPGSVSILAGNGAGAFGIAKSFGVGSGPNSAAFGDINGDGKLDLATANGGTNSLSVLLNDGAGGYGSVKSIDVGSPSACVTFADIDGDGRLDLVVANSGASSVSVLFGDGLGEFGAATTFGVGGVPISLAAADFNGDGYIDLATAPAYSNLVSVLLNDGLGGFGAATNYAFAVVAPTRVAAADLNCDGAIDLPMTMSFGGLYMFVNNGLGSFSFGGGLLFSGAVSCFAMADVNGDGKLDAAWSIQNSGSVSVQLLGGVVGIAPPMTYGIGGATTSIALADLNADGRLDLATAHPSTNSITVLSNQKLVPAGLMLFGKGTPGCMGTLGISANGAPHVGSSGFALTCTNAPPTAFGTCLISSAGDTAGSFLPGLALDLHVDLATFLTSTDFYSDSGGSGFAPTPIPALPALAGQSYFAQGIWIEKPGHVCSSAPLGLVSTKGLRFTIAP